MADQASAPGGILEGRAALVRVGALLRRPPITCAPTTTVADAAALMAHERISSLLIPHPGGIGILTDRDLRTRVVAQRRDPSTPASSVMTAVARTIPGTAMIGEALLTMLEGDFHHLPVVDERGTIAGVLTDTDLLRLGRRSPFTLKRAIERSPDTDSLVAVAAELPHIVRSIVETGVDPIDVGHTIALMTDALTARAIELAIAGLGSPPVAWAWLALGSEARREQGLHSDQDHAIAFADGSDPAVDGYFASLASSVTDTLETAGVPRCRGLVMATEPELRRPIGGWVKVFRAWMSDVGSVGSGQSSIVFDYRRVAGPLDATASLDPVLADSPRHPLFVSKLERRALDLRPPLGTFGRLVTERQGDRAGTVDVKHRGLLIVTGIARAAALARGIIERSTVARLRAAAADAPEDDVVTARELEDAFRFLWSVRLRHQAASAIDGREVDDHVEVRSLDALSRNGLREAFRMIDRAQRVLALRTGARLG